MSWATEYFGPEIITKNGRKPTSEVVLGKKVIGIYFSAHWCPPCRQFTPLLSEFYTSCKEEDESNIEIIFVSSDENQDSFDEYFQSMTFCAMPYTQNNENLSKKFSVRGIPTLVILKGQDGSLIDDKARATVSGSKGDVSKVMKQWVP